MFARFEPEGHARSAGSLVSIPQGLSKLVRRYQKLVADEMKTQGVAQNYISAFHVEPRGTSFLVGFTVGLLSGDEIFVYVEPGTHRDGTRQGKQGTINSSPLTAWLYPSDPGLPSLASVVNTEPLGILFSRLKHGWVPSEVALVAYRPGRRAVVKCSHGSDTAFVKAVRPRTARKVVAAARFALASEVPTPAIIGWSPNGIAIYETATGIELSKAKASGITGSVAVNTAFEALSRLERVETKSSGRHPIIDNFHWYFERATEAHPAESAALNRLKAKIQAVSQRSADPGKLTTIHGDLHLGQLFVTNDKTHSLSGIIDLDGMGLGYVVDDIAGMWANCVASGRLAQLDEEVEFWHACVSTLEDWKLPSATNLSRLHSSIAVHLVAQTLSTRGLNPEVAHTLIRDAASHLN